MKRLSFGLLLLLGAGLWPAQAATNATVYLVTIREDITHNTLFLVRRGLNEAAAQKASALVLELDTNGGRVDATEEIMRLLQHAPMKTYTFINQKAFSAGAFIAAATDQIYMAPGSVIGAAMPVMAAPGQGAQEMPKDYQEKMSSAVRALVRTAAQQKGHNPDVFMAMVDPDYELKIDGQMISEKGKLLTLTDQEAVREYGTPPKPLVAAGIVATVEELLGRIGLAGAPVTRMQLTGFEKLGRWLTAIGPLLITIGILAIYAEMKTPGLGLPALIAAVAFGLFFIGQFAAGLAGWEDMALFALGVALLLVEIFILPGFGAAGIIGIGLILTSLVLGMTHRFPGGPILPTWPALQVPVLKVLLSFAASVVGMFLLARFLPRTSLFRRLELASTSPAPPPPSAQPAVRAGDTGVSETPLRPAGKGRFDGHLVDVVTEGDLIEAGQSIRIIEVHGNRVVVTRES